ncbi:hypothetical protein ABPG75_010126 [Micractinium tetrahymenae]
MHRASMRRRKTPQPAVWVPGMPPPPPEQQQPQQQQPQAGLAPIQADEAMGGRPLLQDLTLRAASQVVWQAGTNISSTRISNTVMLRMTRPWELWQPSSEE